MEKVDDNLAELLNIVFGWSQTIRLEAQQNNLEAKRNNQYGIDDTALTIQTTIEQYIVRTYNINPRDVIDYEKYNVKKDISK